MRSLVRLHDGHEFGLLFGFGHLDDVATELVFEQEVIRCIGLQEFDQFLLRSQRDPLGGQACGVGNVTGIGSGGIGRREGIRLHHFRLHG